MKCRYCPPYALIVKNDRSIQVMRRDLNVGTARSAIALVSSIPRPRLSSNHKAMQVLLHSHFPRITFGSRLLLKVRSILTWASYRPPYAQTLEAVTFIHHVHNGSPDADTRALTPDPSTAQSSPSSGSFRGKMSLLNAFDSNSPV